MNLRIFFPFLFFAAASCHQNHPLAFQIPIVEQGESINGIPFSTRAHWMRRASSALSELASPCPFNAFGTAIVNHTDTTSLGELVCIGVNSISKIGNPTLHGEIATINNCTNVLTDSSGPYRLTTEEALAAFHDLSLYTNGEPCPMCASAIRWSGFRECIYGTTIDTLIEKGWSQINISSVHVFEQSFGLSTQARLIGPVLANETDPLFAWQFDPAAPCPAGCERGGTGFCEESG